MKLLAQNPFGTVNPPVGVANIGNGTVAGVGSLVSVVLKTLIVLAGVYAVINIVIAGIWYISAGGEPKRIQDTTAKIWQSVIGLVVAASAFIIAGIIGQIVFKDPNALLQIQIFTP